MSQQYGLIHLASTTELHKPLLESQVFDNAQVQTELPGPEAPQGVAVLCLGAMRDVWNSRNRATIAKLKERCASLSVHLIGGVGRLGDWPSLPHARRIRHKLFPHHPVVYHCRGEGMVMLAAQLQKYCPQDAIVLDVRGPWPLELLDMRGIHQVENLNGRDRADYDKALAILRDAFSLADATQTVCQTMKEWLIESAGASPAMSIVPCCTKQLTSEARSRVRAEWGLSAGEMALLYSGGIATHQHLEDLVLPFMRAGQKVEAQAKAVILTNFPSEMHGLAQRCGLDERRTIIRQLPQAQVAAALTGADAGLLLRATTPVGRVSQPTKFGEYLAAGLPVLVEKGVGVLPELESSGAGLWVQTQRRSQAEVEAEAQRALKWLRERGEAARQDAQTLAREQFTWAAVSPVLRQIYQRALYQRAQRRATSA